MMCLSFSLSKEEVPLAVGNAEIIYKWCREIDAFFLFTAIFFDAFQRNLFVYFLSRKGRSSWKAILKSHGLQAL